MNKNPLIIAAVFLLLVAGAFAEPIITVDQGVNICSKTRCENSTVVKQGLQNMPSQMTVGIRSIHVKNQHPPVRNNVSTPYEANVNGRLTIYAKGLNTSTYRAAVIQGVGRYYQVENSYEREWRQAQAARKYPLPDWAPRPGACNLGMRMTNSRGEIVCVRPRARGNHS